MANDEHIELLKQGVNIWNEWRNQNSSELPDLERANLWEFDLRNFDLSFANFKNANLKGAKLWGANLTQANFTQAKLCFANLTHANLSFANLKKANLRMTYLENANLTEANLSDADLWNATLKFANLTQANLTQAELIYADFWQANLSKAIFCNADFSEATFSYADLSKAILCNANLSEAILSYADLTNANLSRVQALGTDFTAALFTGICLENWNINSDTKLDNIDCQYYYMESDNRKRVPSSGQLASGTFTKLQQSRIALEIQQLLQLLEQQNPTATEADKKAFINISISLEKKRKLINALKEGGRALIEEFLDNPYVNVVIRIIEGWNNA